MDTQPTKLEEESVDNTERDEESEYKPDNALIGLLSQYVRKYPKILQCTILTDLLSKEVEIRIQLGLPKR